MWYNICIVFKPVGHRLGNFFGTAFIQPIVSRNSSDSCFLESRTKRVNARKDLQ